MTPVAMGPALTEGVGVVEVGALVGEVVGADVDTLALVGHEPRAGRLGPDGGGDLPGVAGEDALGLDGDPGFGRPVALVEEAPGGLPER